MLGHVGGLPFEEALYLVGPVMAALGAVKCRALLWRLRRRERRHTR